MTDQSKIEGHVRESADGLRNRRAREAKLEAAERRKKAPEEERERVYDPEGD